MNPLVLNTFTYGMYAIGVKGDKYPSASIINSVTRVGHGKTERLAVSLNAGSYTAKCIEKTGLFSLSVLSEDTSASAIGALGLVSGNHTKKLENIKHKVLEEGVPVIKENTCCWFLCEVESKTKAGDQLLYIGKIIAGSEKSIGKPMTYDYYINNLGGITPKNSPLFIDKVQKIHHDGESFICSVCGYVYNDPDFSFEELPDNWQCPICRMGKSAYIRNI